MLNTMKLPGILTLAGITIAGLFCPALSREYSLNELISVAIKSNYEIRKVQEAITKTDAQVLEAKGGAMPTVTALVNVSHAFDQANPYASSLRGSGSAPDSGMWRALTAQPVGPGPNELLINTKIDSFQSFIGQSMDFSLETPPNAMNLSIEVKQALYAQGKVSIGLKIAKTYKQTLYCKFDEARQKTVAEVTRLFYGGLLARENLATTRQALDLALSAHRLATTRTAMGDGSALDTLGTRLAVEKARVAIREAESRQRTALEAINRTCVLGVNQESIELVGEFVDPQFEMTLDDALETMEHNSKTLGQLQGMGIVQKLLVKLQKTEYLPMVYCGASVGKMVLFGSGEDFDWSADGTNDSKVFVGASLTLFDGVKRSQKLKQAQSDYHNYELNRLQVLDQLKLGVLSAWESVQTNRSNLESTRSMVDLAQQAYHMAERMYESNALTQLELGQRQNDLNGARIALNAARYALQNSILDLQLLMGTLPLE